MTDDTYIGGNLRLTFPASRVVDPAWPPAGWPAASDHGQCLVVWQAAVADASAHQRHLDRWLAGGLRVGPDAPRRSGQIAAPMLGSKERTFALGYQLLPDGPGDCR